MANRYKVHRGSPCITMRGLGAAGAFLKMNYANLYSSLEKALRRPQMGCERRCSEGPAVQIPGDGLGSQEATGHKPPAFSFLTPETLWFIINLLNHFTLW